jgi:ABC-type uncharacterized transport system involved in gliding motility auxiliary subunit
MNINPRIRLQLLAQSSAFLVLFAAAVMILAFLAHDVRREWDVTRTARNTLSGATLEIVKQLDGPVTITAYAVAQDASGAQVHRMIEERLRPYQRAKPDITLVLVDPREQPKRAAAAGIRTPNELVVEYRKRTEHLPLAEFNEQNFSSLLLRIMRGSESLVLWLDGHGERKLDGIANHDLGEFGRQLQQRGFRINSVNLALAQQVPANTAMLVISTPQVDLTPGEVQKIRQYLDAGGNLLWMIDPEPLRGLQPLAEFLGLVLTPGTVIDSSLRPRSGPPTLAIATSYGRHPITGTFRLNTVFPFARQIGTSETDEWRITPLIEVAARGWVEMGKLDDKPVFDKTRDLPGPVNVASAFERTVGDRQQRVVVAGNSQFLSNIFLGNGGNLQLGLAMVNWLSGSDELVSIEPKPAADSRLDIDQSALYLAVIVFMVVLPLGYVVLGGMVWWRRRRGA